MQSTSVVSTAIAQGTRLDASTPVVVVLTPTTPVPILSGAAVGAGSGRAISEGAAAEEDEATRTHAVSKGAGRGRSGRGRNILFACFWRMLGEELDCDAADRVGPDLVVEAEDSGGGEAGVVRLGDVVEVVILTSEHSGAPPVLLLRKPSSKKMYKISKSI